MALTLDCGKELRAKGKFQQTQILKARKDLERGEEERAEESLKLHAARCALL